MSSKAQEAPGHSHLPKAAEVAWYPASQQNMTPLFPVLWSSLLFVLQDDAAAYKSCFCGWWLLVYFCYEKVQRSQCELQISSIVMHTLEMCLLPLVNECHGFIGIYICIVLGASCGCNIQHKGPLSHPMWRMLIRELPKALFLWMTIWQACVSAYPYRRLYVVYCLTSANSLRLLSVSKHRIVFSRFYYTDYIEYKSSFTGTVQRRS